MHEDLKMKLVKAHKILYMEGLAEDTTRGHITVRSYDNRIYIKPWGMGFEEVTAQDILGLDLDGNLLEGEGRVHSELPLHLEIYRERKDAFSIAHVHPHYSIILSSVFNGKMNIISQNGIHFVNGISFYKSAELINSKKCGMELAQALGDRSLVLMRNHGIVTVGRTIEEAVVVAIDFEKAANEHLEASWFETPTDVPTEIAEKMNAKIYSPEQYQMLWAYYCRKLNRKMS